VLSEVYGIESSEYPVGPNKRNQPGYDYRDFKVCKTHLLPGKVEPRDRSIQAVLLVRDGRDALVSFAHHRANLVDPGSEYLANLKAVILSRRGSDWGASWSRHANAWLKRTPLVIKFEELIENPIENIEKLRQFIELPKPDVDKLPTFKDLRSKRMNYGNISAKRSKEEQDAHRQKFFRKGKAGTWKEEMPAELHELFWARHGAAMDKLGYQEGKIEVPFAKSLISKTLANLRYP
jgi:hypothetical protein